MQAILGKSFLGRLAAAAVLLAAVSLNADELNADEPGAGDPPPQDLPGRTPTAKRPPRLAKATVAKPAPGPGTSAQILLDITLLEPDSEKLTAAGIKLPWNRPGANSSDNTQQRPSGNSLISTGEAHRLIDKIRSAGAGKILAEPSMVTTMGRPASFRAGGEFPIIVPQQQGKVSIEYRRFGTSIDFVPIEKPNGKLRLELRLEVSELDHTRSVVVAGSKIPGLTCRTLDTAIELAVGESAILGSFFGKQLLVVVTPKVLERGAAK